MQNSPLTLLLGLLAFSHTVSAATMQTSEQIRNANIRKGEVWARPAWVSDQGSRFVFSNRAQDIILGPAVANENDRALLPNRNGQSEVNCQMTAETARADRGGATPKFHCVLRDSHGQMVNGTGSTIKVKYGAGNGELYGEVLSTRLLWVLGFGADRMFMVDTLNCFGCSAEPYRNNSVNNGSLVNPQVFSPVAIERKAPGESLAITRVVERRGTGRPGATSTIRRNVVFEGWGFDESMILVSRDSATALRQKTERDALQIIAALLQHVDNKMENQRLICESGLDAATGACAGSVKLIVHDVGATFGGGGYSRNNDTGFLGIDLPKVRLDHWTRNPVWKNGANCTIHMGTWSNQTLKEVQVTEQGRQFALKLLEGFAADPARVEALFQAAQIERRSGAGSLNQWVQAFNTKLNDLKNPPGLRPGGCPTQIN